jgi:hypothetical protein
VAPDFQLKIKQITQIQDISDSAACDRTVLPFKAVPKLKGELRQSPALFRAHKNPFSNGFGRIDAAR